MKFFYRFLLCVFFSVLLTECARRGNPDGGPKDETAPIMVTANPPHESTGFNEEEVKLEFDEYVVVKDLTKQLIVSPPFKNPPLITPQGTPSKYIKIEFLDTLKQNTTYTINFGNSIQDNNENNKIESFKYVFSTGKFIDSLTLKGKVTDAITSKLNKNVSVLLYEIDSAYTDSIPLKQKPNYVSKTSDSLNFTFSNLKKGNYAVMAIEEEATDYIFNPKSDKIAFLLDTISLPKDSILNKKLVLFNEAQPFVYKRGREVSKGKIQFGFTGKKGNFKTKLLSKVPGNFKSFSQIEKGKDTLNYWFTPIDKDSLNFIVSNTNFIDTVTVRLRKKKIDSLVVSSNIDRFLKPLDTLFLTTNTPILKTNKKQFSLIDKDTNNVSFELKKIRFNKLAVLFKKKLKTQYKLTALPNAISDLYEVSNDTLNVFFDTKDVEDYGAISITVNNKTQKPLIIELLSNKEVLQKRYVNKTSKKVYFKFLNPQEYTIRAIVDNNNNRIWDTGNFLNKVQPERIVLFNKKIELRSNWEFNEVFTIK